MRLGSAIAAMRFIVEVVTKWISVKIAARLFVTRAQHL